MKTQSRPLRKSAAIRGQRGVVLLFSLIALLILMMGAVAIVRSFNTSLVNSGNIAFKRDLKNRSEVAVAQVLTAARALTFDTSTTLNSSHYSATMLGNNKQGIPNALLVSDSAFDGTYGPPIPLPDGVTIRWVIDRQCNAAGADNLLSSAQCIYAQAPAATGGSSDSFLRAENAAQGHAGAVSTPIVYRLSMRATGPRNTVAFYQSTFTR